MNITKLLQLLTEDRSIEHINKTFDKVPDSVKNTLSSKMKKDEYDNTAMAILRAIQNWEDGDKEKLDFLIDRAKLVYAALKESAKGKSNFHPEQELDFYKFTNEEPLKYWADFRSDEKRLKERGKEKKEVFGIPEARVKELPESYLFFPRNFKFDIDGLGFRISDLNKQHEDIKALSNQMAKKDTSGEDGADVNHWCVAASDDRYFRHYKKGDLRGIFVIIVDKNKDGSPNWNKRYLWWIKTDGQWEFADKFDDHVDITDTLPASTRHFLTDKIAARLGGGKGDEQRKQLYNRAQEVYHSNIDKIKDGSRRKIDVTSASFKNYIKILRFLRSKYTERHSNEKGLFAELQDAMKDWASHLPLEGATAGNSTYRFNIRNTDKGRYMVDIVRRKDGSKVQIMLTDQQIKSLAQNINNLRTIKKDSYLVQDLKNLEPESSFRSRAYHLSPEANANKAAKDALRNNKIAIDMYEGLLARESEDEIREFFVGPYFIVTAKHDGIGQNLISVLNKPWSIREEDADVIGDLGDKNIVEKVKAAYEELAKKKEQWPDEDSKTEHTWY